MYIKTEDSAPPLNSAHESTKWIRKSNKSDKNPIYSSKVNGGKSMNGDTLYLFHLKTHFNVKVKNQEML